MNGRRLACAFAAALSVMPTAALAAGVPPDPLADVTLLVEQFRAPADADDDQAVDARHAAIKGTMNPDLSPDTFYTDHYLVCVNSLKAQGRAVELIPREAFPPYRATEMKQGFQAGDVTQKVELQSMLLITENCEPYWAAHWRFERMTLGSSARCTMSQSYQNPALSVPKGCQASAQSLDALRAALKAPPPAKPRPASGARGPTHFVGGLPCDFVASPLPPTGGYCSWRLDPPRGGPGFGDLTLELVRDGQGKAELVSGGTAHLLIDLFRNVVLVDNPEATGLKQ